MRASPRSLGRSCWLWLAGCGSLVVGQVFPSAQHVNLTHRIQTLGFGMLYPGIENPLDGVQRTVERVHTVEGESVSTPGVGVGRTRGGGVALQGTRTRARSRGGGG